MRLWDPSTGNPIGEPLKGHTYPVSSVAFSPAKRHSSSARLVVKKTMTPEPGPAPSFFESGVPE